MNSFLRATLTVLAVGQLTQAHTGMTNFFVDGVDQGPGVCVRMNLNAAQFSSPVENLASADMACGFSGTKGVARVCDANDGSTLTFRFQNWANDPSHGVIDPGHHGPCAVYMKKVDSSISDPGTGSGWFKIWDEGYDEIAQEWCVNKLIAANGLMTVQLPKGLVGGFYLIRPELLALHNAVNGDPQFYTGCAQVFLKSTGSAVPENTVSIPGHVKAGEPSVSFNIYESPMKLPYPVPGPGVTTFQNSGSTTQTTQTEGLRPVGCIMENANWCGAEVPDYTTSNGCWSSSQNCWDQGQVCWNTAPPTGGANCELWQNKCKDIQSHCSANDFNGPPNKGQDLTPPHSSISPPAPLGPTTIGNSVVSPASTGSPQSSKGYNPASLSSAQLGGTPTSYQGGEDTYPPGIPPTDYPQPSKVPSVVKSQVISSPPTIDTSLPSIPKTVSSTEDSQDQVPPPEENNTSYSPPQPDMPPAVDDTVTTTVTITITRSHTVTAHPSHAAPVKSDVRKSPISITVSSTLSSLPLASSTKTAHSKAQYRRPKFHRKGAHHFSHGHFRPGGFRRKHQSSG